jgi:hypothetical protein
MRRAHNAAASGTARGQDLSYCETAHAQFPQELVQARIEQEVSNVLFADRAAFLPCVQRKPQRGVRDVPFSMAARSCCALYGIPIVVAGIEIHTRIHSCRIRAQDRIDAARTFDECVPLDGRDIAQARDASADSGSKLRDRLELTGVPAHAPRVFGSAADVLQQPYAKHRRQRP